jgi:hypothetical protein
MSIEDMSRYLITQMNGGVTPDGRRIVSAENLAATWQPGIRIPDEEMKIISGLRYGMGWMAGDYRGVPLRFHGGGWKGYTTMMATYPEHRAGLIVFTNHSLGSAAGYELLLRFAELLDGLEPQIIAEVHAIVEADVRQGKVQAAGLPPYAIDRDTVTPLLGEYEDDWRVELRAEKTLWLVRPGWEYLLYPLQPQAGRYLIGNQSIGSTVTFSTAGDQPRLSVPDLGLTELAKLSGEGGTGEE